MKIYWKDILDDSDKWAYLEIIVSQTPKLSYHIQSGGKQRFKLTNNIETIFWGCIELSYYGVWFLRNDKIWETKKKFIPPITSAQIEESITKNKNQDISFWSKFFSKSLSESEITFLHEGTWKISEAKLKRDPLEKMDRFKKWKISNLTETYEKGQLSYTEWTFSGNSTLIPLKNFPIPSDGRLKWWTKKVKEGTCPPILIWYVHSLDSYLIIDGHYRLKASMNENRLPKILVLNQIFEEQIKKNDSVKEKIVQNIEFLQKNQKKEKLNVKEINNLLIHAFDERPSIRSITKSIYKSKFEELWISEVLEFRDQPGIDSIELDIMIENKQ